jgi:hypothetical protein
MEPHRTGSTQKATKASIFPVVETVIEGRATMIAIRSAVITSSAYSKVSGDGKLNATLAFSTESQEDEANRYERDYFFLPGSPI